jgi:hypothetical protein
LKLIANVCGEEKKNEEEEDEDEDFFNETIEPPLLQFAVHVCVCRLPWCP